MAFCHVAKLAEPIAPFLQTRRQKRLRSRIFAYAHAAPVHRFHVHRPERLNAARAHVRAHRIKPTLTPLPVLLPLLTLFFTAQLSQIFRMLTGSLFTREILKPARKDVPRQTVFSTIDRLRKATAAPRLNMQRPIKPVCLFPGTLSHRRSSNARRNPICREVASSKGCVGTGRLRTLTSNPIKRAR